MLCLCGFELYSRWVPLILADIGRPLRSLFDYYWINEI